MLKLILKNSCEVKWKDNEYDDYYYDGRVIVIRKDNRMVGLYNIDNVISLIDKSNIETAFTLPINTNESR